MSIIDKLEGQRAYGNDPETYDVARPPYPQRVFDLLHERCGLRPGARVLEIGAGTGHCTRKLIQAGAIVTAVEPDERMARFLITQAGASPPAEVVMAAFEDADLPASSFDLITCASAFHWLNEMKSLRKIAGLLRDGGSWAVWWNLLFDNSRTDELHQATESLFRHIGRSPSAESAGGVSFALDKENRIASMKAIQTFDNIACETIAWTVTLDTAQIRRLYSTFSPIRRLHEGERTRLLDRLAEIVDKQFGGKAQVHIRTPFYSARNHR